MPVPTVITDLSTTAASNSPAGSDSPGPDGDNHIRALAAFIAQLYAGKTSVAAGMLKSDGSAIAVGTPDVDYLAADALLLSIAGQTVAANKIQTYSAADTASLLDFKDEDDMASNSATAVPSQQSVKAYVDASIPTDVGIGVGQTWQDVTASRTNGATYTNSTGKPIQVNAFDSSGGANLTGYQTLSITVDGVIAAYARMYIPTATGACFVTAIVPNGSSYVISMGGSYTALAVRELR